MLVKKKDRFLIAILISESLRAKIDALNNRIASKTGFDVSNHSRPHITLHMPFEYPIKKEELLIELLKKLTLNTAAFNLVFDGVGSFNSKNIILKIQENEALMKLQNIIVQEFKTELKIMNGNFRNLPFDPHVTLAGREIRKSEFEAIKQAYQSENLSHEDLIANVVLMKQMGRDWKAHHRFDLGKTLDV